MQQISIRKWLLQESLILKNTERHRQRDSGGGGGALNHALSKHCRCSNVFSKLPPWNEQTRKKMKKNKDRMSKYGGQPGKQRMCSLFETWLSRTYNL